MGNSRPLKRKRKREGGNVARTLTDPTELASKARELIQRGELDFSIFLPPEISVFILSFLDLGELATASRACKTWHALAAENSLWRRLALVRFTYLARKSPPKLYWDALAEEVAAESAARRTNWRSIYRLLDSWSRGRATVVPLQTHEASVPPSVIEALVCGEHIVTTDSGRLRVWTSDGTEVIQSLETFWNDETEFITCLAADFLPSASKWTIFVGGNNARYHILSLDDHGVLHSTAKGYLAHDGSIIKSASIHRDVLAVCMDVPGDEREGDADGQDDQSPGAADRALGIAVFRIQLKDRALRRLVSFRSYIAAQPVNIHIGRSAATSPVATASSQLAVTVTYCLPAMRGGSSIGIQRFLFDRQTGAFRGSSTGSSDTTSSSSVQAISFDGSRVIATFTDNTIRIFHPSLDFKTLRQVDVLHGHTASPTAVRVSNLLPGKLVSGSRDGTIKVWNIAEGHDLDLARSSVVTLAQARDERGAFACGLDACDGIRTLAFDHLKVVASHEDGRTNVWRFSGS